MVPTVINGKVYVGTANFLSVYGLLSPAQAAAPILNPGGESFSGTVVVTITDSTPGASIYYTTDGSTPTTASTKYTGPITVSATQTINAIASAAGYVQSPVSSETYNLLTQAIAPTFSPVAGSFSTAQAGNALERYARRQNLLHHGRQHAVPGAGSTSFTPRRSA